MQNLKFKYIYKVKILNPFLISSFITEEGYFTNTL